MSYNIVITKKETVKKSVGGDWETIGQIEKPRDERYIGKGESETYMCDEKGYTPQIQKSVDVEIKILEQTVVDMDVSKVIMAINGIGKV